MSRIDEALRRAGAPASHPVGASTEDMFAPAWEMNGTARVRPMTPPAATDERGPRPAAAKPKSPHVLVEAPNASFTAEWRDRVMSADVDPALGDQFKRLAASLLHGQRDGQLKTVMVTSAVPGEGKTLTALNLALVLSQSYQRNVLLVEADLRRPRLSEAANLPVTDGLGEVLKGPDDRSVSVLRINEHLTLLPAGRPDPDPLSGLTSPRMQRILDEASERFDWVIVDTPPVSAAADAGLLSAMVDAVLLVVRAGQTPHAAVQRAVDALGRERIFGVVLNGVAGKAAPEYTDYGTYKATD